METSVKYLAYALMLEKCICQLVSWGLDSHAAGALLGTAIPASQQSIYRDGPGNGPNLSGLQKAQTSHAMRSEASRSLHQM